MANIIGQSLERYHILEQLGEGGMATVYKAFDTRLERNVAIKVILPGKQHSEKFLKRFEREAKALAGLSHPNIVGVIDYGEQDGMPYLVMEYIPGGTLKHKLTGNPMPWQEAAKLLIPIARALAYAHENKIIHRDVKPSNILITQSGEPMLSDFGIAKMLEVEETLDLTGTGVGVGTPEYMSPEQAQGKQVDARSDIYSLGVVFYEMVTGCKPYQADTPMAVVWKLASEPLPRPKQFAKDLPDIIEGILLKALSKAPGDRYQSMDEMASILERVTARADVRSPMPKVPLFRKGILIAGLAGTVLLALLSIVFWLRIAGSIPGVVTPVSPSIANTNNSETDRTYLAAEDFEDGQIQLYGFSVDSDLWRIVDDENGNKVYQVDNRNGDKYLGFTFGAEEWMDYSTEFRMKLLAEGPGIGLQVRSNTSTAYYVVDFDLESLYLAYPDSGKWVRITTSYPPIQTNVWHTVKVDLQGDRIQVYIDGSRWIDERDNRFQNGEIFFFASPGTYAQVDDIKVWEEEDTIPTKIQSANLPSPVATQVKNFDDLTNPTETSFPSGLSYLLLEDFEDGLANGWISVNNGTWSIWKDNGNTVYGVRNQPADYIPWSFYTESANWQDYAFETDVIFESGRLEQIWLNVRTAKGADCTGYSIGGNRYGIAIMRFDPRTTCESKTLAEVPNYPLVGGRLYTIRIEAKGAEIRAYIDDELVMKAEDTTYPRGGIAISAYEVNWAYFDNIRVYPLSY